MERDLGMTVAVASSSANALTRWTRSMSGLTDIQVNGLDPPPVILPLRELIAVM